MTGIERNTLPLAASVLEAAGAYCANGWTQGIYAPDDLETGPRQCQHAQRCPGLSHLPLPKGGYCITAVCKEGSFVTRTVARTKANCNHVVNLEGELW